MAKRSPIGWLRTIGLWEGISFLILVFVCMPFKYMGGQDIGVKIFGPIHGGLFVMYCAVIAWNRLRYVFAARNESLIHIFISWPSFVRFLKAAVASNGFSHSLAWKECWICFFAALLPFGPFLIDKRLERLDGRTSGN
jgi:integral membrane protein